MHRALLQPDASSLEGYLSPNDFETKVGLA